MTEMTLKPKLTKIPLELTTFRSIRYWWFVLCFLLIWYGKRIEIVNL